MSCRKNEGNVFSGLSNFNFGCCFNSSPESQFFPTPISAGAGAEVKVGEPLLVSPGEEKILHLSQACLGESKSKGSEQVFLYVKVGNQKLVLGTLSSEKFPQVSFDLVFDKEFELSHNWKNGSVHFTGYTSLLPEEYPLSEFLRPFSILKKVQIVEPNKVASNSNIDSKKNEDSEEDDTDDDENESSGVDSEDSDEDSDDSLEEDEQTPKKAEASKKRPLDSANKTPAPDKKAKLVTPQKTDGKKGVAHVDTPHPSKKAGKMPAANDKTKQQTPKSANAAFPCKTCNRTFGSETALQSHTKAKHTADK
ncbi:histone deacetylase HDT1 [Cucumis melo var. makuwa]|uniref:Histone deacetylase HDT1 n=1 Tax=Cucumis melo var. makuwa TaxID=1194695 RepID=A0A5A7TR96_CUCMM|nr:histone deacetylase HDT1 [Cucumis melo var. makuwa]